MAHVSRGIAYVLTKYGQSTPIGAAMALGEANWHRVGPQWRAARDLSDAALLAKHAYFFRAEEQEAAQRNRLSLERTPLNLMVRAARRAGLDVRRSFEVEFQDFQSMDDASFVQMLDGIHVVSGGEPTVA